MTSSPPPSSTWQENPGVPPNSEEIKSRLKDAYDAIAPEYNAWTVEHSSLRNKYLDKLLGYLLPSGLDSESPAGTENGTATWTSTGSGNGNGTRTGRVYRVLELGCGAGVPVTERLVNFDFEGRGHTATGSFHVIANDLSGTQVELGKERLGGRLISASSLSEFWQVESAETPVNEHGKNKLEWIQGDMTTLSFPDESFDAVIAMYSLIHLPREEQSGMISRIARWLKRPSSSSNSGEGGQRGGIMLLNFGEEASEGDILEKWLGEEKGWMYWSGWGAERTLEIIRETENGLEVLDEEVVSELEEGVDVSFLWIIARRCS